MANEKTENGIFTSADGGDVLFIPGAGYGPSGKDGSLKFHLADGEEILRFDRDRSAWYRGRKIEADEVLVAALRDWFLHAVAR